MITLINSEDKIVEIADNGGGQYFLDVIGTIAVDGVLKTPTIFEDAFAIYGTVDYLGTGNNVVRFYNIGASTSERDFTEAELTDGTTYSNWLDGASSSITRVAKLYNQLGDSDWGLGRPFLE